MRNRVRKYLLSFVLVTVLGGLFLLSRLTGLLVDGLWFAELDYFAVFLRLFSVKIILGAAMGLIVVAYFGTNLHFAFRRVLNRDLRTDDNRIELIPGEGFRVPRLLLGWAPWLLTLLLALPYGLFGVEQWDSFIRFFWSQPFGRSDPIYNRDLGYYLFQYPFLQSLQNSLTFLAFLTFCAVLALSLLGGFIRSGGKEFSRPRHQAARHLTLLFIIFLAGYAWGFYLDRYELLFSSDGVVYGAGYTDLKVVRVGLWAMVCASAVLALTLAVCYRLNRLKWALWSGMAYLGLVIATLLVAPFIVQKFIVAPNELELESPFLQHEISFTREAYGVDHLQERSYPALSDLTRSEVTANQKTLENVRLWDWRPLLQTFRQLQEIRLYYQFYEVDIDRYHLDGEYQQVMLAARELAPQLPERADTWVNRVLQFTHGYGLVMSPASQEGKEGTPRFLVKDLPPTTVLNNLRVAQAAIYYGEKMPGFRIVNSGVKELDYPKGDQNAYTRYAGQGGILLDSFWKKLLFAWQLNDINILISGYPTDGSRLQMRRRIQERIATVAPFLRLDNDPYLVLAEGKIYWIQDAYTISDRYPYSDPYGRQLNYIRNSVKVIVDAYEGSVDFYMMQEEEPILQVYRRAFPSLFRPLAQMPAALRGHLRYPENLFRIQVEKFNRYHMKISQVFYNNEDLWTLPEEKYAGDPIQMEPYYILMRLPGEDRLEFLLMLPLTPRNRDNMIAWMAARCDEPEYGKLLVYKLPKEKLILGPMQVEAMIDQDPVISQQLSLWDQRGSKVIRGNLLVIPLDHSFIYVEPVYLIAEGNNIPQLRRVIVAYNDRVAMEPTLDQAVRAVFELPEVAKQRVAAPSSAVTPPGQLDKVRNTFEQAQQALQRADWQEFGRAMDELKRQLEGEKPKAPQE